MSANLQQIMRKYDFGESQLFFSPRIPGVKLSNAIAAYAQTESSREVIALLDDTVFGGAKDGLLLTRKGLYFHEMFGAPLFIRLEDIKDISIKDKDIYVNNAKCLTCSLLSKEYMPMLASLLSELVGVLREEENNIAYEMKEEPLSQAGTKHENIAEEMISSLIVDKKIDDDKIKEIFNKYSFDDLKVYFSPEIPEKKLKNAIEAYAYDLEPDDVILLLDETLLGGAKEGMLVSSEAIYFHELLTKPVVVKIADIENVSTNDNSIVVNGKPVFKTTMFDKKYLPAFAKMLNQIVEECAASILDDEIITARKVFQELNSRNEHFFFKLYHKMPKSTGAYLLLKLVFLFSKIVSDRMPKNKSTFLLATSDCVAHELIIYFHIRGMFLTQQAFINNDNLESFMALYGGVVYEEILKPFYKFKISKNSSASTLKTMALQINYEKTIESVLDHRMQWYSFDFTDLKANANQLGSLICHLLVNNLGKCNLDALLLDAGSTASSELENQIYKTCEAVFEVISDELNPFLNRCDPLLEKIIKKILEVYLKK